MAYAELLARLAGVRALGVELGLERVRLALARLGDPQTRFAAVQIAGTNGKGSTAALAEAVLREAGVRTALYSSPHLARFTERIRIAGREVDGDRLAALDRLVIATEVPLTYFEVATALAFLAIAEAGVEVAVLETGLGGRLDAVTTCVPCATAITSIGLDHTDYLGDSLPAIAREKAGILKPGVPCFVGRLPADADVEIDRAAEAAGAPLFRFGADFGAPPFPIAPRGRAPEGQRRARGRSWPARSVASWAGRSTIGRWRAGWRASAGRAAASGSATICCSTAPTTRTAPARWRRRSRRWRQAAASCCWSRSSTTRIPRPCWRRWRRSRPRS